MKLFIARNARWALTCGGDEGLAPVFGKVEFAQRLLHGRRIDGLRGACRRAGQKDVKLPDEGLGRFRLGIDLGVLRPVLRPDADSAVVRAADRLVAGNVDVGLHLRVGRQMQRREAADRVEVRVSAHGRPPAVVKRRRSKLVHTVVDGVDVDLHADFDVAGEPEVLGD